MTGKFIETTSNEKGTDLVLADIREKLKEADTATKAIVQKKKNELVNKTKLEQTHRDLMALADVIKEELGEHVEPRMETPYTWTYYSAGDLARGDALEIDGVIYIYLKKLAWWRNKTANILVAQHHAPDKQKRIGELDYVKAFKGYIQMFQLSKMGVNVSAGGFM